MMKCARTFRHHSAQTAAPFALRHSVPCSIRLAPRSSLFFSQAREYHPRIRRWTADSKRHDRFQRKTLWGPTFFGGFCCHEPWGRAGDGAAVKTPATYISANPPARTVLAHCTYCTATPQKYVAGLFRNGRPRCSVAAVPKGGGFTLGDCHPKSNIPHERGCSSCSPAAQKPQSCRAW